MIQQSFADQLKAQSDIWQAQLKDFQEQLARAGMKAGENDGSKAVADMKAKVEEATKMAERIRTANEAAWKDMVTASQKAFVELQRGWADAVSRFR